MNLKMNNCFCNYVLTIKQLKDRFLWRGGRGVKTPLGRYSFKKEEGVLLQGQHSFGGELGALLMELCSTNS